jgi:uncharacterized membrane protein YphA (DoxX/SURF4 family)
MLNPYDDYDRNSRDGFSLIAALRTIAPLRVGAGLVLFIQYALEATLRAWHFIWQQAPWSMIDTLASAGLPMPRALAPVAAFITVAVAIAWTLGFFTRLFSVLFLPVVLGALVIAHRSADEGHETAAWLFLFICGTLILNGSGAISLDRLFRLMSKPKSSGGKLL